MTARTYPLTAVAHRICGEDGAGMKDPAGWVARQIRAGRFEAYKIGRELRMSDAQIEAALQVCRRSAQERPAAEPEQTVADRMAAAMSPTTKRRLKRAS